MRLRHWILTAMLLVMPLLAACNTPAPIKIDTLPVPSQAKEETLTGELAGLVNNTSLNVRNKIKELGYGVVSTTKYLTLHDRTSWNSILNFYKAKLGSEWVPDPNVKGGATRYKYAGWRRGSQTFAINFVDWQPDYHVLMLMLTD